MSPEPLQSPQPVPLAADVGGLPPEAMAPLTIVDEGLKALHSWLELIWPYWPYLLLLPLLIWAWVAGPNRLRSLWGQALEHPLGGFWPVLAATLPALIPFARDWDHSAPLGTKRFTVSELLLAIAIIQIYGQLRSQRYRKAADDAIGRIGAGVDRIGAGVDRIGSEVKQQGTELGRLAAYLTAEDEEEENGS